MEQNAMPVNLEQDPNYDALIDKLVEKTVAGKLHWRETAEENIFFAPVKGVQTFEIRLSHYVETDPEMIKFREGFPEVELKVKNAEGNVLFEYTSRREQSSLFELYRLVRRIVMRVDEKIGESLELLNNL